MGKLNPLQNIAGTPHLMLLLEAHSAAELSSLKVTTELQRSDSCLCAHGQEPCRRAAAPKTAVKEMAAKRLRAVPGCRVTCQAGLAHGSCKTRSQRPSRDLLAFFTH